MRPHGRGAAPRARGTSPCARAAAGLLVAGLLLPVAGPAAADSRDAPDALPGVSQQRRDATGRAVGCLPPSTKGTQLTPWPQTFLRPDRVWPLSRGEGVTVAVLGSGVKDGGGLLAGRLDLAPLPGGPDPAQDCVGHGTFLAGLIAADQREGAGFAGLAPRARILAVSVTNEAGTASADLLAQGITTAADRGARIIAVGVALPAGTDALAAAVRAARGKGALIVAPAAPDTAPTDTAGTVKPLPAYPAAYPEVLAVRDLAPGGTLPEGAGAVPVGGRIDLAAPGDAVTGPGPAPGGYYTGAGPSFATAFVAGTAALVLGYRPDLTADQLTQRLEATAYRSPDPRYGHGTVDPVAAVTRLAAGATPAPPTAAPDLAMPPAPPASDSGTQAGVIALSSLAVIALAAAAAAVAPRARARGSSTGPTGWACWSWSTSTRTSTGRSSAAAPTA
ncbi:S8 family serine peptidase, partial [Kitasatospora sp. NPDC004799]|uniref:S8 family serine peptidase n=1 Tax=Kitasatospora sp. NPDC004799 TaxID=3154460 RepID=UPI00339FAC3D